MQNAHWAISVDQILEFLLGNRVSRVFLDFSFGIEVFTRELKTTIRINTSLDFTDTLRSQTVSPDLPASVGPVLAIFGTDVEMASAKSDGTLILAFSHNLQVVVHPDPKYEAWELFTNDGRKIISTPGGGLATWGFARM